MRLPDLLAAGGWLLALVLIAVLIVTEWRRRELDARCERLARRELGTAMRLHDSQRANARLEGRLVFMADRLARAEQRADELGGIARQAALAARLLAPPTGYDADISERHQA